MAFDYKKEYKEFYLPPCKPALVDVPAMQFVAVRGQGDPNAAGGAYQTALDALYAIAYTLKMSYKGDHRIEGFFEYVVPPLEGFWWQADVAGIDYSHKENFCWISALRLPDFIAEADFLWAREAASKKKKADFSAVEFFRYQEGLCVQCMHLGSFDDEPATVAQMDAFLAAQGYANDITDARYHHEIYLNDARKCEPSKLKTVLRHPVRKLG